MSWRAGFLILLAGCGGPSPETASWVHLAAEYAPPPDLEGGLPVAWRIEGAAWTAAEETGLWLARPSCLEELVLLPGQRLSLEAADRSFAFSTPAEGSSPPPGSFGVGSAGLLLRLEPGEDPPPESVLELRASAGAREGERWRIAAGGLCSDGFPLRPGEPAEFELEAGGVLRFATGCLAQEPALFRVLAGERLLLEHRQEPGESYATTRHELALEAGGPLRFEVAGSSGYYAIHAPVLAPADPPPARDGRPDLVLFLADTFRADNLRAYGGEWEVTPHLDRFAAEGQVFEYAWAPAAWTLPSQTSMLLGLHPLEHGVVNPRRKPAPELRSVAQQLARAGYRTVAVTDSVFVSRIYRMDAGFEWFEELSGRDLNATLEAVAGALGAGDGRPSFLFVHTYRTHSPYAVSPETLAELGPRLDLRPVEDAVQDAVLVEVGARLAAEGHPVARLSPRGVLNVLLEEPDWYARLNEAAAAAGLEGLEPEAGAGVVERLRRLYLGAAADLDRGFGQLLELLGGHAAAAGREPPVVVFTSDHGEYFGEHDELIHGRGVWDEVLRVPLVISGPGLEPGRVSAGASLVDLPPTLCELAGVALHPDWSGRSLLAPPVPRPLFADDCARAGEPVQLLVDGLLKLTLPRDPEAVRRGEVLAAFDVGRDPGEREDLVGTARESELGAALERWGAALIESMEPRGAAGGVALDPAVERQLRALGYALGE